jgi:3-oxoacyl-[acyl-carrier protein] reductase
MNRVALVTGASRGIGLAVARRLATEGFDLTVSARSPETLDPVAADLRSNGVRVEAVPADMALEDNVGALAREHDERFGRLDVLALCAGFGSAGPFGEFPIRRFDKQYGVNLRAPFLLVQSLLPLLRASAASSDSGAKVVAIASLTGMAAEPDMAAYGAVKAGLISLCESITIAEGENGVSATAISPGYVDTDMTGWIHDRIDPERMIRTADIAELVATIARLSRWACVPNVAVMRPGTHLWRA